MITITVNLSEDRLKKLVVLAQRFNIPEEELLRLSFEEFVSRQPEDFQRALDN
jgi:hypothetical protein